MNRKLAVIGVGNMARAIINGIISSDMSVEKIFLYDKNKDCCSSYTKDTKFLVLDSIEETITEADCILIAVKPQNYAEVLDCISSVPLHEKKLYISIGAGITVESVSSALDGAGVVRVLPNLPMTIGKGVSAICRNDSICEADLRFVEDVFSCAGSTFFIDETEMNRIIGVTSSSPAYVFKFIDAICKGAECQGLDGGKLLSAVCDVVIGAAELLKNSADSPALLISKVASKGGTTERALATLDKLNFDGSIEAAMIGCTERADELGKQ